MRRFIVGLGLAGLLLAGSGPAAAQVDAWQDEEGFHVNVNVRPEDVTFFMQMLQMAQGVFTPEQAAVPVMREDSYDSYEDAGAPTLVPIEGDGVPSSSSSDGKAFPDQHSDWGGPPGSQPGSGLPDGAPGSP
ncbi:MAG: hypothetical protein AB1758_05140 [Candidatus Eremiobacterota bacterium]